MKAMFSAAAYAVLFFGTSIYLGLLWALHFFWYPTWTGMTMDLVPTHFLVPVNNATEFFTIVLPLMLLGNAQLLWREWRRPLFWAVALALGLILTASAVGRFFIFPINDQIAAGHVESQAMLNDYFLDWMRYNDVRGVLITATWLVLLYYVYAKGELFQRFRD